MVESIALITRAFFEMKKMRARCNPPLSPPSSPRRKINKILNKGSRTVDFFFLNFILEPSTFFNFKPELTFYILKRVAREILF